MISRGVRGLGDVRRWWCPVCNEWDAMRGPAHYLRGGPEHGLERVAALACRGLSVHAIQKRTGMSWGAVQLRMQRLADEAKNRYRVRAPGVGSGWWCVALPETFPKVGVAAVGKQRQSYRLLGWATGAEAGLIIEQQMGCAPLLAGSDLASAWLERSLGSHFRGWTEAEQRLWILLAWSNGWKAEAP